MPRTLHMHIGMTKTGSTTIQNFCNQNRERLLEHGLLYPTPALEHPGHVFYSPGICKVYLVDDAQARQIRSSLMEEIAAHPQADILFSSEVVLGEDKAIYDDLIACAENCRIIVFLRSMPEYFESIYAFRARDRMGKTSPFTYGLDAWTLKAWVNAVRRENCAILSYDQARARNSLLADFFAPLHINPASGFAPVPSANESLKPEYALFCYHLQQLPLAGHDWLKICAEVAALSAADKTAKKWLLLPTQIYTNPNENIRAQIEYQASLLGDPDWVEKCMTIPDGREPYPGRDLLPERQHELFAALSPAAKDIVARIWQPVMHASAHEALLPSLPDFDGERRQQMRVWQGAYLKAAHEADVLRGQLRDLRLQSEKEKFAIKMRAREEALNRSWQSMPQLWNLCAADISAFQHISAMHQDASGLALTVEGRDPILLLPFLQFDPQREYFIHLHAQGADNIWQIFYITDESQCYTRENKIDFDINDHSGDGILIGLPPALKAQPLRLDCGAEEGDCLIRELTIYELPAYVK